MTKRTSFKRHAEFKLSLLRQHGFKITKTEVERTLGNPLKVRPGYAGRKIAEGHLTAIHLIRVVFEELPHEWKVITIYPARRDRYENKL